MKGFLLGLGLLGVVVAVIATATDAAGGESDSTPSSPTDPDLEQVVFATCYRAILRCVSKRQALTNLARLNPALRTIAERQWPLALAQVKADGLKPPESVCKVQRALRAQARARNRWWVEVAEVALPAAAMLLAVIPGVGVAAAALLSLGAEVAVEAITAAYEGADVSAAVKRAAMNWLSNHPDYAVALAGAETADEQNMEAATSA